MKVEKFVEITGAEFFTGVPDSRLKCLCDYLIHTYGVDSRHHIIGANEGNCVALAAGYHLATGKVPLVYMQNSGEGNAINPVTSLLDPKVYAIPEIFVIGWRGEPGVHDEPQHICQGEVTLRLLQTIGIPYFVIGRETSDVEVLEAMRRFRYNLGSGRSVAFVVRKGAFTYGGTIGYRNDNVMKREEIIRHVVMHSGGDPVVSTTGKASRELFEIREAGGLGHKFDFLTVGSMGHSSSIALGLALGKPNSKIWCVDGDGAVLMHMGAMAVIGSCAPTNLVHIVVNNSAHESVGGQPNAARTTNLAAVAKACGYPYAVRVGDYESLDCELAVAGRRNRLTMIEAISAIGSREDLGRPTTTPVENKTVFMEYLDSLG